MRMVTASSAAAAALLFVFSASAQTGRAGRDGAQFGPGAAGQHQSQGSVYRSRAPEPQGLWADEYQRLGDMHGYYGRDDGPWGRGYPTRERHGVRRNLDLDEADRPWRDSARTRWWEQSGDQRLRDYHFEGDRTPAPPRAANWNQAYGGWVGATSTQQPVRDRVRIGRRGEMRVQPSPSAWQESDFREGRVRVRYGTPLRERGRPYQAAAQQRPAQRFLGSDEPRQQFDAVPQRHERRNQQFERDFDRWFDEEVRSGNSRNRGQQRYRDRWY